MGLSAFLSTQVIDTTSVGRSVMTAADAAAARAAIGAGTSSFDGAFSSLSGKPTTLSGYGITDAQPLDSDLTAIAALTTTTYGRSLLTGADAAATRTTLGLGTLATQSGTFSGTSSGTNTGDQTITLTGDVTGSGTGSFSTTIANSAVTNAMLAGSIAISKLAITGTPDGTKFLRDDGTWAAASGGSGLTSLNGLTGSTQTFAVGTSGTDFTISSTGTAHTFNIPDASASARGLVTTGTQTFAGAKTFSTSLSSPTLSLTNDSSSSAGLNFVYSTNGGVIANNGTRAILFNAGGITLGRDTFIDSNIKFTVNGFMTGASNALDIRNSTSAQTVNIANTYTSSTNFEYGRFQWSSNEWRIGTAVGSAGGTQRSLVLGTWNAAGTWTAAVTMSSAGVCTFANRIELPSGTVSNPAVNMNANGAGLYNVGTAVRVSANSTYVAEFAQAGVTFPGVAFNSGSITELTVTAAAHTGQTASTEAPSVNFNLSATKTFAAGALTTQRAFRIQAPTYAFASASTITTASTLSISGAPIAGTNATITNPWALNVESGNAYVAGDIAIGANIFSDNGGGTATIGIRNGAGGGNRIQMLYGTGFQMASTYAVTWSLNSTNVNSPDLFLYRDAAGTLAQRNSTNAQTFRLYNTYTSATSGEWLQQSWVSNEARIGTAVGSAGGTGRSLVLGSWNSAGTWTAALTVSAASAVVAFSNNITLASQITFNSDTAFRRTSAGVLEVNNGTAGTLRDLCLRNFAVNSASVSAGGGVGIVFIANATTVPTTDPTGGGILYVEGGALKYRGSSGTVTTLAPA